MAPMSPRRANYTRDRHPFKACCAICGVALSAEDAWMQIVGEDGIPENVNEIHPFYENPEGDKLDLTDWLDDVRFLVDKSPDFHHMKYHRDEQESYIVPFHDECFQILQEYLGPDEIDVTVLYDTFVGLSIDEDTCMTVGLLGITSRYEAAELLSSQTLSFRKDAEYLSISPMEIPELDSFYEALPLLQLSDSDTEQASIPSRVPSSDPFRRLAPEMLYMVASNMHIIDVLKWRSASPAAASCPLSNAFWKGRVHQDMAWLFDFPELSREAELQVDWERVFWFLKFTSNPLNDGKIDGLTNRRYIWEEQCPQIALPYAFKLATKNVDIRNLEAQVRNMSMEKGEALTHPAPLKVTQHCPTLFNNLAELDTIEPVLVVSWTEHGDLASIDIEKNGRSESDGHMYLDDRELKDKVVLVERVPIPRDDWLTGLGFAIKEGECWVVYSRNMEDDDFVEDVNMEDVEERRVLTEQRRIVGLDVYFAKQQPVHLGAHGEAYNSIRVARDKFVVGLTMTRRTYRGTISHAALIQGPAMYCLGKERFVQSR
ncbi:hypothetical protein TOPH_02483 [Tolypocladium ophioglossoides CBS 100239]|uniref:F-box domain-containing protein n=1 Tax=Tolypocladium ophioglossoides (strain CBS 100239) TaxID=1163406 RepID=A0A0L0NH00_TOLOC|nr:hypothetical protein TOPH_02483 [Tolypocladium ophioglossoides CBS 100239]